MSSLVWFVTGCATGFGYDLALAILARGDKVIATSRRAEERLQDLKAAGAAILELDVAADQTQLNAVMNEALKIYGGIDVLVNNAGYMEAGVLEEVDNERYLKGLQTNYLGPLALTRAILPHFRSKRAGKLIFISSIGAYEGTPLASVYFGTKGALESAVPCIAAEVAPFGINCCVVIPGYYRTNIFAPTQVSWETPKNPVPEYEELIKVAQAMIATYDGKQPGDPRKAMECIVDVVRGEGKAKGKPFPSRLPLGPDALAILRNERTSLSEICDEWEDMAKSTNFAGVSEAASNIGEYFQ